MKSTLPYTFGAILNNVRHCNPLTALTQLRDFARAQPVGTTCLLLISLETGLPVCVPQRDSQEPANATMPAPLVAGHKAVMLSKYTSTPMPTDMSDSCERIPHPEGAYIGHPEISERWHAVSTLTDAQIVEFEAQGWLRFNPAPAQLVHRGFLDADVAIVLHNLARAEGVLINNQNS